MKKVFVKTKNVKNFSGAINNLIDKSSATPKMGLIYGAPGLGKSHTAIWWATKNNALYVRAQHKMNTRWLLQEILAEIGEEIHGQISSLSDQCKLRLKLKPQVLIVDEIDYLLDRSHTIEALRDIHDTTGVPVVLIGMQNSKNKLGKYQHLYDRLSEIVEFNPFSKEDVDIIVDELSEVKITDDAKQIIFENTNRFRQLIKDISLLENLAKTNGLNKIDVKQVKGLKIGQ